MESFQEIRVYDAAAMAGRPPIREATDFGKRVAAARQQRGFTQRELADLIGTSRQMVDYLEHRATNVKSDMIVKLAEVLGVSADELLGVRSRRSRPGPKSKLQRQIEQIEALPQSKQKAIVQVLEMALQKG